MAKPLPPALLKSLENLSGYNAQAFIDAHEAGRPLSSIRLNPAKALPLNKLSFELGASVPWTNHGHYLLQRPVFTLDPLLHAGAYYVQEASSMFLEQVLAQHLNSTEPMLVLDLCGAPGGKSTHLQSLLNTNAVLVCNEVIKTRVNILTENLTKWGAANVLVTNNDPADFGKLTEIFDVIVVDAPCSGSGLFRKDLNAINEWSEANVNLCSQRQQRILADVWPALKPGGVLVYSTCSYSPQEDEDIADWLIENYDAKTMALQIDDSWGIVETASKRLNVKGYRFFPHLVAGEGFYLCCIKKGDTSEQATTFKLPKYSIEPTTKAAVAPWLKPHEDLMLYRHNEQVFAMPSHTWQRFQGFKPFLNIRKAGCKIGDMVRTDLVPDHALALSQLVNAEISKAELSLEDALNFLRKNAFETGQFPKGWVLMTHQNLPLGFIKNLGNRSNNYYPQEWRIRMS